MRKQILYCAAIVVLAFAPIFSLAQNTQSGGQQPAVTPSAANAEVQHLPAPAPKHFYKLDFVLRETDDSKTVNQRNFILNVSAEPPQSHAPDWWNVRAGTRIPLTGSNPKDVTYVDIGVNLDVRSEEVPEGLQLQVSSEISSSGGENIASGSAPIIRQLKVRGAVLAPIGKPTLVFAADDPGSRHHFELEVTPVRMK